MPLDMGPTGPEERSVSCKICPLFTHSISYCIHVICNIFSSGGWDKSLSGRFFHGEGSFRGSFTVGEFAITLIQNSFYMPCFLFSVSILHVEMLR